MSTGILVKRKPA